MNNGVIAGVAVVGVVGLLSQGYLSQLKQHIKDALGGNPGTTGIDNTLSIGGNPSNLGTSGAPQLPGVNQNPWLSSTAAGMPGAAPQPSTTGQPTLFSPGTLTLDLGSKGLGIVEIPDNTSSDTIVVGGQYITGWRQYLISPLIPGSRALRPS